MSIVSNMKEVTLQKKAKTTTPLGSVKETWTDDKKILVCIFKNSDSISIQSVKYNNSTHTGLTSCKELKEGLNRIVDDNNIYEITGANSTGRLNNLMLKVVDTDV